MNKRGYSCRGCRDHTRRIERANTLLLLLSCTCWDTDSMEMAPTGSCLRCRLEAALTIPAAVKERAS